MAGETEEAERRWQAVIERDPAFDGRFVYSVKTTGVYCRPSCAARRARPENVAFFDSCAEAERAGFRACKRCRPNEESRANRQASLVARLVRMIEQAEDSVSLEALAAEAGLSPSYLHRLFKRVTGVTPRAYAMAHRAKKVRDALSSGEVGVTEAIYAAGYNSSGRFYEQAGDLLGMTPSRYRAGGEGARIEYATGVSSLGTVLVARSERGLCAILMGEDAGTLARDLAVRFPRARVIPGVDGFAEIVAAVVAAIEHPRQGMALPLDIRGTAFQQRVWQALRAIPPGSTATYREIACSLGAPKAYRAVAAACAANPLAVAVPCHRVVRGDGSLAGYRWGLDRKRALLDRERE